MKNILTVFTICGLTLCVQPSCDEYSCTITTVSCDNYDSYMSCLRGETDGCTSSQSAELVKLQTLIDETVIAKNAIGCGVGESCYSGSCVAASETEKTCTGMYTYISCLQSEIDKCTSTQPTERNIIQAIIDSNTAVITARGCGSRSTCNIGDCTMAHGRASSCPALNKYFDCPRGEVDSCTSGHTTEQDLIQTAIDATNSVRDYYRCSGSPLTVSESTLAISLLALHLKP